ncbi:hypothetical protein NM688_g1415 [Phlebia brevispora]|uniref:Uncharacterized protein n=1 Tax=Phlebia brevispora TaxID=194682 RepID=A0ACC1TBF0_9APHY|nr:hypothetical protein NM688_g1415 [Phlebia brevispora]
MSVSEFIPHIFNEASGNHVLLSLTNVDAAMREALSWDSINLQLASDTKIARRCLEIVDGSDVLPTKIRLIWIDMVDDTSAVHETIQYLANVIIKAKNLENLSFSDRMYHNPKILAALCTRQESRLEELMFDVSNDYLHPTADLSDLHDLQLTKGSLTSFELEKGDAYLGIPWPKPIFDAILRLIRSSAHTMEHLALHSAPPAVARELAHNLPSFPVLQAMIAEVTIIEGPAFATVHPTVTYLKLHCPGGRASFVLDPDRLRAAAQRFPSLKTLSLAVHRTDEDYLLSPSATLSVLKTNLISFLPQLEKFSLQLPGRRPDEEVLLTYSPENVQVIEGPYTFLT